MLIVLGWSAALGVSDAVQRSQHCNTAFGKLRDQVENRIFRTALKCRCDGQRCTLPLGIP
jgi:hypothetical protein